SAVGLALLGRLVRPPRRLATIRLLCVLWPLPLIVTGLRPPVAVTVVLWAVAGALASYQLLANLIFVEGLDPAVRGRAFAFARAAIIAAQGIGLLLAGYLADVLDPATAVALAGIAGLVLCPYFAVSLYPIGRHRAPAAVALDNANDSSSAGSCRQDSMPVPPAGTARLAAAPGQSSAPTNGAAHDQARYRDIPWRSILIYGVSLAILVAVITVTATGVVPNAVDHAPIHLSWWALALIFAFTDLFVVPFQRGSESTVITLSQLPVVLALLLSSPVDLVIGALVGLGVMQFRRWPNLLKCTVNRASEALLAITASGLFYVFRPEQDRGWWLLLAALVATLIADTTSVVFVVIVRRIFDRSVSVFQLLKPLVFSVPTGTAAGTLGLLAVAAMWQRATFGWLLAVVGVLVVAGARSYADLQERHQGLGQLYEFKQQLGPLVTDAAALTPVLERTREILMATRVELSLAAESGPTAASGLHRVLQLDVDGDLVEFWRTEDALPEEDAGRCITVQLAVGTRRLGTLSARDRLGPMRGFRRADLHLLQTLGAQMSDALERGRLIGRLQEAATHDALTGLLRLNELAARLDDELVQGRVFVVVLADVSRLTDVNDSLGREAGDALLRTVADRLREFVPPEALVARSGGGEFAVAIPDLEGFHAGAAVDRLSQLLTGLVQVLGVTVDLRTRLGWAASAQDGRGAATLLRRADLALGVAKRGVEHVQRYRGDMEVDGMRRLRLVNDLRVAIDRREIDVVFQPLVTPRDGVVVGAEALARWTHPELGPLRPDEFIVVAEQSGLIGSLTEVVLDKALAQTQRWERAGRTLRIAVNLSARSLADLSMPGTVVDLLARHRVAPDRLTLEVTETSVAEDPARAEVVL
ncbi:MAG TPA: EAL domain-containing protein, partial [Mycobacteriales bacterium]|nr:EAL domain-containing protein [Mycobacteriales bacterium]